MNVRQLMERLEDLDPEAEVLMATQPNWPLRFTLTGVALPEDIAGETPCEEHGDYNCDECFEALDAVIYLVEGDHPDEGSPYAPSQCWSVAR